MAAYNAMWLPGTDHAGIATQMVVERELREKEKQEPPRHRPRGVRRARLGVAGAHRRPDPRAAQAARLLARLGADHLHDGSAVLGGGPRGVRAPARGGPDLPRAAAHQLVPVVPDGALRPGGRLRRGDAGRAVRVRLSAGRRLGRGGGRDDAPRDDAGRHRGRRAPGRSALQGEDRQDGAAPARRAGVPDHRRRDPGRPEVRHRRRQGDAGARSERLRDRPAPQPADDLRSSTRRASSTPRAARSRAWTASRRARRSRRKLEGAGPRARLEAARARGRPLPALRDGRRADAVDAVVREDGAAGQAGHRGGGAGQDQVRPRELVEDVLPLDEQHPRLVHLAAAVVGPPHPGLVLRQVQRDHGGAHDARRLRQVRRRRSSRRTRTCSTPGSRRGCGRSRRSAGRTRRAS